MSIQLGLQIFGLTCAIAVCIAQVAVLAVEKMMKNYFSCKLAYMDILMKRDYASDGFKDMLADIAKRHNEKVV